MESATIAAQGTPRGAGEVDKGLEAVEQAKAAGVEYEVELINEHPNEALMTIAGRRDARMIVVGSHGEAPRKGAVLGSTPYKVVHFSRTPVLVVRP